MNSGADTSRSFQYCRTVRPDDWACGAADQLVAEFTRYGKTLVAFSGGVDSSVALAAAVRALDPADVAAVTAVSAAVPAAEVAAARDFCAGLGVAHHVLGTREMEVEGYRENGPRRCYFCKSTLIDAVRELADRLGFQTVVTGTNASDVVAGFRPGIVAAAERAARTPLADLAMDKPTVRAVARLWGLDTAAKPAAACLASRIAYGVSISPARLARVELAESAARRLLDSHGVVDLRVRDLGDGVRLEVDAPAVERARGDQRLVAAIRAAGFPDEPITVEAFRSGSMNELLHDPDHWR
ncbi:ATP-dependent sacrificial sulfur transferase LarE [Micromonospora ureilytica]|uniref:ATP-dependent sacrificial sulfur transferase LarE n=1 Tax=Micromonospora ureilytica TaxID=709868 RepID=A0A3N9XEN5_9ACTN|nr:ATP-dependent sacrificial sulfur transferase LarE [Micromonospora ureilytica]RQX11428.1 ATP-dependent sacrificial sulfur transferase LarE [Micromonospora ureilytica]